MTDLSSNQIEALKLVSTGAREHMGLPVSQRLHLGRLWAEGLVRLEHPDTWSITERGLEVLSCLREAH